MNAVLSTIGRILYALPFGVFGIMHLMNANAMEGMVPFPPRIVWIYVTGAALLAACISILINKKAKLASLLLGIMLIIFVLAIHLPGVINAGDQSAMQMSMANLLKDMALSGAAFIYSSVAKD